MQIGLKWFRDQQLSSMIESNNRIGNCDISGENDVIIYDTDEDNYLVEYLEEILDVFTVAKYLNIDESDERATYLKCFLAQWNIFSADEDKIQIIVKEICHERYLDQKDIFEEKVTIRELFDIDEMEKSCILKTFSWEDFCYHIKHINRFHSHHINEEQLKKLLGNMMITIPKGTLELYRARICDENHYIDGYLPREMGAPPVNRVTAGRTNSEGIQCLYLSSSEETTYHEVRARDCDFVSVGTFQQTKDLKIVDLSLFDDIGPFSNPDFDMTWFAINIQIIRKIGNEIAKPMRRFDSQLDYVPTQYLCDYIKHLGYDGIKFKSTLISGGINYAIFDERKFNCIASYVREIGSVIYCMV